MHAFFSIRAGGVASVLALVLATASLRPAVAIETMAREAILVDESSGSVLFEKHPDQPMPPASMSKIMTAYMAFSQLRDGKLKLDDTFPVSENAWRTGGSSARARRCASSWASASRSRICSGA